MSTYAGDVQTKSTPQTEPIRGKDQIQNRAGGYGFKIDDWARLHRFLILGHEGGTYYATQRELSLETVDCLDRCLAEDPTRTIEIISSVSLSGRAPKNDPSIFALAYVVSKKDKPAAVELALSRLPDVCRIGTHLFQFIDYCKTLGRGWGHGFRYAIARWYRRQPGDLAMQVTKYANRKGWTHRDVLRKCHAKAMNPEINAVLQYVCQHDAWIGSHADIQDSEKFLAAVDEAKEASEPRLVQLIQEYGLVREHLPTKALNSQQVWDALLIDMPLTAMIRNLGKMASIGLTIPLSQASSRVCVALGDTEKLKRQRVHPLALLIAQKVYRSGRGVKGSLSWAPSPDIAAALDDAFYHAFETVEPTGKNHLLGVDVSGSMSCSSHGSVLTCAEAAAAMAMLAARTEQHTWIFGFEKQFVDLGITSRDSLDDALAKTRARNFGGTDCSLPMRYARENNLDVDAFCVYTDNETWAGQSHPCQDLEAYRQKTGRAAKLAVFGLANTNFSIADPNDAGMMDFVGFDASSPAVLADFVRA